MNEIKIAIVSFGRGMATFVRPWRTLRQPPPQREKHRGIGIYFARVGSRLSRAAERYGETHPEIPAHAD